MRKNSWWRRIAEAFPLAELVLLVAMILGTILLGVAAYHYTRSAGEELYRPPGKGALRFLDLNS